MMTLLFHSVYLGIYLDYKENVFEFILHVNNTEINILIELKEASSQL